MSTFPFDAKSGPVMVEDTMTGPLKSVALALVLDTGATTSLVNVDLLRQVGLIAEPASRRVAMTTGSAVEMVPLVVLTRLSALGQHRFGFSVVAHSLPPGSGVDGLLGLDFLRALAITIDFPNRRILIA